MSPPALDRVVMTCLAKDPEDRWQNAGDVGKELKWVAEGSPGAMEPAAAGGRGRRETLAWAIAALAVVLGAAAVFRSRRPQAPEELTRFTIPPPSGQSFLPIIRLSPDARRIAFLLQDEGGRNSIGVRALDSLEMLRLAGTQDARGMVWSPDGREIAFFSEGRLRRIGSRRSARAGPRSPARGVARARSFSRRNSALRSSPFPRREARPGPLRRPIRRGAKPMITPPSFRTDGTSCSSRVTSTRIRPPSCSPLSIRRRSADSFMRTPRPCSPIATFCSRATTPSSPGNSILEA
jgi:hypothetical protein